MHSPPLEGITIETITTPRLTTRVRFCGPEDGTPVLFLHGNISSGAWFEEMMLALPPGLRGIAPDQRGYGGADPAAKIDATRGLGDLADDAIALLDHLGIERAHGVGHSLGGCVVWWLMRKYPARWITVTQIAPGSPYGFGGTKDANGTPCYDDFAGSGGGLISPLFLAQLQAGDRGTDSPFSPRKVLRAGIVRPPLILPREDAIVESILETHLGADAYPGDMTPSPNWPFVAPGVMGPNNALSPRYAGDVSELYRIEPKPPVLWLRGADDQTVADAGAADPATVGRMGLIPGWPGEEVYPAQPMIAQIRAVLGRYQQAGGRYAEVVIAECAHAPQLEKPAEVNAAFHAHLRSV
jgi:pimeloyl-ACP methyl ester carboxylesterase